MFLVTKLVKLKKVLNSSLELDYKVKKELSSFPKKKVVHAINFLYEI